MNRHEASKFARETLDKNGLSDWKIRISNDGNLSYLGLCVYTDRTIYLNAFHIDIHPEQEVVNTILHEVAHALTPGHNHDEVWNMKARELGCDNTQIVSHLTLPPHIIDAIRSGATIEMTVEEQVIRRPKYEVTRLQEYCPICLESGKKTVAKERFAIETVDKEGNTVKLITLDCFHIIKKIIPRGTDFGQMVSNDWKPEVKSCQHEWIKNQCSKCGEYRLYNFQTVGARFIESALSIQKGAGIFDDMGLGKTVQALAILRFHADKYIPCMIVTKSAIKFQWFKQIIRWLGPDFMSQVISTSRDYLFPNLKTYIIPYDLLRRFPREKLHALGIKLVILDECQQIKNPDSARTQEVRRLVSANPNCKVLPLSGTPWKNRGGEFFPVLNMMDPIKFYSYHVYFFTWVYFFWDGQKRNMGGFGNIPRFRNFTSSMLIRREYEEVMDEFPDINRTKLPVQLGELEQETYDDSVSDFVAWYNDYLQEGREDSLNGLEILAKMSRMRHITGLAKIPATLAFIEEFVEDTNRKLVIFVHHKDVGELMHQALTSVDENNTYKELVKVLKEQGIAVFKYTSELSDAERFVMQEAFNKVPRAIMIASTLACGEGVDLQTCSDAIMHERQWNPQNEDQAAPGRFRRIGQKANTINITFPEAEGTIDEHLEGINDRKRKQYHAVMNNSQLPAWSQDSVAKELADIIVQRHKERMNRKKKVS